MEVLTRFSRVSGLTVNEAKSQLLNINLPEAQATRLRQNFPFVWSSTKIKYLGIYLTPSYDSLYEANYPSLFSTLKGLLEKWRNFHLSWLGRIAAVKMTILPKLLYHCRVLPIRIPLAQLKKLQSSILQFIWAHKKHRIAAKVLYLHRSRGGLGVPDVRSYYHAARMSQLTLYHAKVETPIWVNIEAHDLAPTHISNLLWIPPRHRPNGLNPITLASLKIWDTFKLSRQLCSPEPPLLSFLGNPAFPSGLFDPKAYQLWSAKNLTLLHHLMDGDKIIPFHILQTTHGFPPSEIFRYLQIASFVNSHTDRTLEASNRNTLTPFEKRCRDDPHATKAISELYMALSSPSATAPPKYMSDWQTDLGTLLTSEDWTSIWKHIKAGPSCDRDQDLNYKVLSRWYLVPSRLHMISPNRSPLCFRGCQLHGSYIHIWWSCPTARKLWRKVFQIASILCKGHMSPDPAMALLHLKHPAVSSRHFSLLKFIFTAAKSEIAVNWNSPSLSIGRVKNRVSWSMAMEKRSATLQDRIPQYERIWGPWTEHFLPQNRTIGSSPSTQGILL